MKTFSQGGLSYFKILSVIRIPPPLLAGLASDVCKQPGLRHFSNRLHFLWRAIICEDEQIQIVSTNVHFFEQKKREASIDEKM